MSFDKRDYIVPEEIYNNHKTQEVDISAESFVDESTDDMRQISLEIYRALQNRRKDMYVEIYDKPNYKSLVSYLQKLNSDFRKAY